MKLLSWLHRWTGGIVGILLAVIGLSGTVLLWEGSWIMLPGADDQATNDPAALGRPIAAALELDPGLSRITFAGEEIGLHQAIYGDGSGAYLVRSPSLPFHRRSWKDGHRHPGHFVAGFQHQRADIVVAYPQDLPAAALARAFHDQCHRPTSPGPGRGCLAASDPCSFYRFTHGLSRTIGLGVISEGCRNRRAGLARGSLCT